MSVSVLNSSSHQKHCNIYLLLCPPSKQMSNGVLRYSYIISRSRVAATTALLPAGVVRRSDQQTCTLCCIQNHGYAFFLSRDKLSGVHTHNSIQTSGRTEASSHLARDRVGSICNLRCRALKKGGVSSTSLSHRLRDRFDGI